MPRLSTRKLLRLLTRIGDDVAAAAPTINCGGCAIIAHLVGAHLERLGIPCEVVTTAWGSTASEARANVANPGDPYSWDDNGLDRTHLALRFRIGRTVYTWDTDSLSRDWRMFGDPDNPYEAAGPWGTGLTLDECRAMTTLRKGWNPRFSRRLVPAIRRIVAQHFAQTDLTSALRARTLQPAPQLTLGI